MKFFRKRHKQAAKRKRSQKERTMFAISRINPVLKQRILDKAAEERLAVYVVASRLLEKGLLIEAYEKQTAQARHFAFVNGYKGVDDATAMRLYKEHLQEKRAEQENKVVGAQNNPRN